MALIIAEEVTAGVTVEYLAQSRLLAFATNMKRLGTVDLHSNIHEEKMGHRTMSPQS